MGASTLVSSLAGNDTDAVAAAQRILRRLLRGFRGSLDLRLWNDSSLRLGTAAPEFTLVVRDPAVLRELVIQRNPLLIAEAHFRGLLDFEGDLYAALKLKPHFQSLRLPWPERLALWRDALRLPRRERLVLSPTAAGAGRRGSVFRHRHSRHSDQAAIEFHYDVSNQFYRLWLDEQMVYSCAYFESPHDSIHQAQRNKLDHICRKLRLQPGDRLLDIGCGWGALVCWAALHYGVQAHGITLSRQQLELARERIAAAGLQDRVTVELLDYRDLPGNARYDKVSSVGMFEHVGLANLPIYHATVQRVLADDGLFLNHGITHDTEGWAPALDAQFINRYVFPDGELDTVSNIQSGMERAGFEILDVEGLRMHYAMTLRHWVQRLEAQRNAAREHVSEATWRVWRLYMAASALEFEAGGTGIYQILSAKRRPGSPPVPLTRRDLYGAGNAGAATAIR
jgi:cyclopropane-fatty-acyl-phospholipid synthase